MLREEMGLRACGALFLALDKYSIQSACSSFAQVPV